MKRSLFHGDPQRIVTITTILVLTGGGDHGNCSMQQFFNGVYASFWCCHHLFKGEYPVVKPEWGIKRHCQACGANFYDLRRSPIICPKCDEVFDPEAFVKPRRSRAPVEKEKAAPVKKDAAETPDEAPAEKDEKTGDKLAAAEGLDDNLVTASLDEEDNDAVFVPSEELEPEPDFQAEGEGSGDAEAKPDEAAEGKAEKAGVTETEAEPKTGTKPAKAEPKATKVKKKPGKAEKAGKAKPAKAEPKTTKPKKETKAKPKTATKKKAEPKKKAPAKAKAAKGKKA